MNIFKNLLPLLAFGLLVTFPLLPLKDSSEYPAFEKKSKTLADRIRTNEGRAEYFFNLMRDPATNSIPPNIRSRELRQAESLPSVSRFKRASMAQSYDFTEVGPNDVGGRTRALALDINNSSIVLAGGVSGGMWRSTNSGNSWDLVTDPAVINSVTSITQDPTPGNTDTWYFSSGEFSGNSASSRGGRAFYYGNGIFKSTDNGLTWSQIPGTSQADNNNFNSPYDYISKIQVSPSTGSVFFASNGFGIYRSLDGLNFTPVLGNNTGEHAWSDFDIAPNGDIVAVLSEADACGTCTQVQSPGVYLSEDNGSTWADITPGVFPAEFARSVVAISPSTPNEVYILNNANNSANLIYMDMDNPANNEDRTTNLPDFGGPVGGFNLQGGYNMVLKVHPTDPDIILTGGTNLYLSLDGFTTGTSSSPDDVWIGGYAKENNVTTYENHHPDNHALFFDPANPNVLWSGHDGGVSVNNSLTSTPATWIDKNNGYNVTQFYGVSLFREAGDTRIMGGTQDNGSPYFNYDLTGNSSASDDISSGDGSYSYFTSVFAFVSSQRGNVRRLRIQDDGSLSGCYFQGCQEQVWTSVSPSAAEGQLFVHPFELDPYFTGTMYYPSRDSLYRNNNVGGIPDFQNSTMQGWSIIPNVGAGPEHTITTLESTLDNPRSLLYFAGYNANQTPTIRKIRSATNNNIQQNIDIPGAESGSYPHDISVNPTDGNEVIVIFANYNVPSIFHSSDAGETWVNVEGNLAGDLIIPGPSVRSSVIVQTTDGPLYFVGTSTGLYSTDLLDGNNTVWVREAEDLIGKSVVEFLDHRPEDNVLAVATHGRGIFIGEPGVVTSNEDPSTTLPSSFRLDQNYPNPFNPTTNIRFSLPSNSNVSVTIYSVNGQKVADLASGNYYSAGSHTLNFDASELASGIYIYRISAQSVSGGQSFTSSRKMTLIK